MEQKKAIASLKRSLKRYRKLLIINALVYSALWGVVACIGSELLLPGLHWASGVLGFLLVVMVGGRELSKLKKEKPAEEKLLLGLDMSFAKTEGSVYAEELSPQWEERIVEVSKEQRRLGRKSLWRGMRRNFMPVAVGLVLSVGFHQRLLQSLTSLLPEGGYQLELQISKGQVGAQGEVALSLARVVPIQVKEDNLLELVARTTGIDSQGKELTLELSDPQSGDVVQGFQLLKHPDGGGASLVRFSVDRDVCLVVSQLSANPLACIEVFGTKGPLVRISEVSSREKEFWADNIPFKFSIRAVAETPIESLKAVIQVGDVKASEEIASFGAGTQKTVVGKVHSISFEPYIRDQVVDVILHVEALDTSHPVPKIGKSNPIRLKVASAYARYQMVLNELRNLKLLVDQAMSTATSLDQKAKEIMAEVQDQASNSPFLDRKDRYDLQVLSDWVERLVKEAQPESLIDFSQSLNQFLEEHENLDDRERDRDLFVAARALSGLIEKGSTNLVRKLAQQMRTFLDQRRRRWQMRVGMLEQAPEGWEEILSNRPFQKSLEKIAESVPPLSKEQQLTELSKLVSRYKEWLNRLENKEDEQRERQEEENRKTMMSARKMLEVIRKTQAEISQALDKAELRGKEDLELAWPAARAKENSNIRQTRALEKLISSFAPLAGYRLKAATDAMVETRDRGEEGKFVEAESFSDLSNRLLRMAAKSAQNRRQQARRRARRHMAGDKYYGTSLQGADIIIRSEYEVDRRFRENILDEAQRADYGKEDRELVDQFIRRTVR